MATMSEYESLLARVREFPPDVRLTFVHEVLLSLSEVMRANSSKGPTSNGSPPVTDDEIKLLQHVGHMEKYA